jgi:hypothetical protein
LPAFSDMGYPPMNATFQSTPCRFAHVVGTAVCCAALLFSSACHKTQPKADADAPAADAKEKATGGEDSAEGVALKPDEIVKTGIVTTALKATVHAPETMGFGTVMPHEALAQAVAELTTAVAVERQSRSAFARGQRLAGTAGAMPVEAQEAAERQATVDQAALDLAKRRMSSTFGQDPPWKNQDSSPELTALASGKSKLVRVTFPLGALGDSAPSTLRLAHINATPGGKSWESRSVWSAPADASIPGKSFFALLKGGDAGEGEHLLAWAGVGAAESGVEIPASAVIISNGKYWCYVEEKPGVFVRTEIDTGMPTADGYFVKEGVSAGDKVVTASAGQLLAREMNPNTAAE